MYIMWCWLMSLLQGRRSLGTEGEEWSPSPGSDPGFAERLTLFQSGCRLCQRSYNSPTLYYTKDIKAVVTILLWNLKYSSKYVWSFCRRNYFHSCNYFLIFRASYGLYYMLTASGIACKNRRPTVFQSYLTKRKRYFIPVNCKKCFKNSSIWNMTWKDMKIVTAMEIVLSTKTSYIQSCAY